jgi:uncharacterized protein with PIN domain
MIVDTSALIAIVFKEPGTAKLAGQPLLYVGEDFSKTDLEIS